MKKINPIRQIRTRLNVSAGDIGQFSHGRRGYLIVEAMVAISILTFCFLGIIALLNNSIRANRLAFDSYIANYLAMEGIEIVKNLVDANINFYQYGESGCSWDNNLFFTNSGTYEIDWNFTYQASPSCPTDSLQLFAGSPLYLRQLWFSPSTNSYGYSTAGTSSQTPFTRQITVTSLLNEIKVISTVAWNSSGRNQTISLEDHFFNWVRK